MDLDEGIGQGLRGDGLFQVGQGPEPQAAPRVVRDGNDVHGDVPGAEVLLEALQDHQSVRVRQAEVERDGVGLELLRQGEGLVAARGDQAAEAPLPRHLQQDVGEVRVVLHDQEHPVPRLNLVSVVLDLDGRPPLSSRGGGVGSR